MPYYLQSVSIHNRYLIVHEEEKMMDVLTDVRTTLNTLELKGWLASSREVPTSRHSDCVVRRDRPFHIRTFGGGYLYVEGDSLPRPVKDGDRGHVTGVSACLPGYLPTIFLAFGK